MILRATYRRTDDPSAPARVVDVERPEYDGAWAVARASALAGEQLIHVRSIEEPAAS